MVKPDLELVSDDDLADELTNRSDHALIVMVRERHDQSECTAWANGDLAECVDALRGVMDELFDAEGDAECGTNT